MYQQHSHFQSCQNPNSENGLIVDIQRVTWCACCARISCFLCFHVDLFLTFPWAKVRKR